MSGYRRGPPAVVLFKGFEANTASLEHAGWRIAEHVEFQVVSRLHAIEMILSAPDGRLKLRARARVDQDRMMMHRDENYPVVIHVGDSFTEAYTQILDSQVLPSFREIDMSHTIMDRMSSLQWGSIFPPRAEAKEDLFLRQADIGVMEHLEAIKKLQAPKQRELRDKAAREMKSTETIARLIQVA